ncbi:MAG: NAD(P)/FAD-dependent oxidoreductase [Clostridia bacterium]|nr:NAD(P)/FAD-dependent oxidoreductase [Clostridia bacterium]
MIKLSNVKIKPFEDDRALLAKSAKKAGVNVSEVKYFKLVKKSLDARDKSNIFYNCSVELSLKEYKKPLKVYGKVKKSAEILVVGMGPAGLFCALDLQRYGFNVTLIERGKAVDERSQSIDSFIKTSVLDEDCNIQFGEGGAGAFSDGKLNTGVGGALSREVIDDFLSFGAPSEIDYLQKPHIGSDKLKGVVKNIRNEIIRLGGKVFFSTKLSDIEILNGKVKSVTINGERRVFDEVVLAVGHSARDVYYMLERRGVMMESKDFAVGLRIEHLQKDINFSQYGSFAGTLGMPVADYKLTTNFNGRGVFTFCMCPGGYVMPSASEKETIVTNGMSNFLRDGENANSAVICQVNKKDFGASLFGGIEFQKDLERNAFILGGGDYRAPSTLVGDYLTGNNSEGFGKVKPTYPMGVKKADVSKLFSADINASLKFAITDMARRLKGFDVYDAVLTGVESRTSSPVRVIRGDNCQSVSAENLYPCGEGCGYAGGITSAGADGKKVAKAIAIKYGLEF